MSSIQGCRATSVTPGDSAHVAVKENSALKVGLLLILGFDNAPIFSVRAMMHEGTFPRAAIRARKRTLVRHRADGNDRRVIEPQN